ncbi:hypothetical protein, partial [Frigoribacterium sp. Leaf186]|uniref:hypothetical protein n=1 Tax=Frigoribacterium sp. Leaf186 TaxID=1736293 RepID=UPI001F3A515A
MPGYNLAFDNVHAVEFSRTKLTGDPALEDFCPGQMYDLFALFDDVEIVPKSLAERAVTLHHLVQCSQLAWSEAVKQLEDLEVGPA